MRDQDVQAGGKTVMESKEKVTLIEGVTLGLGRNLMLRKFLESTWIIPVKTPRNSKEGV